MRTKLIFIPLILTIHLAHAQQYGWVQVAQVGNQFTNLQAIEFADSLHGWIAEGSSTAYKTLDGGSTWTLSFVNAPLLISSISMLDTTTGWCVGAQGSTGRILRTTDGGNNWLQQFFHLDRNYNGTTTTTFGKNITSGFTQNSSIDTGKILQTTNGGLTWPERTMSDSIGRLGKMQFIDSLHGWIISGIGTLRTVDGGATWSVFPTPRSFSAISFIDELNGWASSGSFQGSIYRTTDGGVSWMLQYCFCSGDSSLRVSAISFVDSLKGWVFGTSVQGDFIGAIHGTTDGGWSWQGEHFGQLRHINDGLMLDEHHGWAVGDGGGVVLAYKVTTAVAERMKEIPRSFSLRQNYPNPFNPVTSIEYEVIQRSDVEITVYDVNGKEVLQLINGEHEPGVYRVQFDATGLASGVYYYSMRARTGQTQFSATMQLIFLK